jgi:glycosyltransferase involved in cell wall biosynthesis
MERIRRNDLQRFPRLSYYRHSTERSTLTILNFATIYILTKDNHLGRWTSSGKRSTFAIRIMSHLVDSEFQLIIIGDGADGSLADAIRSSCSHSKVTLIGNQPTDHVHAVMRTGFAYLNTSINEGMCLAILEAMALGLPVIARRNIGNVSIVKDGRTGL